jgi:hypothetical protein
MAVEPVAVRVELAEGVERNEVGGRSPSWNWSGSSSDIPRGQSVDQDVRPMDHGMDKISIGKGRSI